MTRTRRPATAALFVALALGLTALSAGPANAEARRFPVTTCTFDPATATVTAVDVNTRMTILRQGDAIALAQGGILPQPCAGGPTIANVDLIRIDASAGATVTLDLRGGSFAPGLTPEADGSSEIEIDANLDAADLVIAGGAGADAITAGTTETATQAVNLNARERTGDADLTITGPTKVLTIEGGGGRDRISAAAGAGFARGFLGTLAIDGGGGRDRLLGGPQADYLEGGGGADRIRGLGGADSIEVRDGVRDRADCGPGNDLVTADRADRLRGCERAGP